MFEIGQETFTPYTFLSLFSGAGGLDLGFEKAGFLHTQSGDILSCAVNTLKQNRPEWDVVNCDVREYIPNFREGLDVLLAGFPCQGFSLGGNRDVHDSRNTLYREVIRIAKLMQPRVIVMENVLNLRTMKHPETGKPVIEEVEVEIADSVTKEDLVEETIVASPIVIKNYTLILSKIRVKYYIEKRLYIFMKRNNGKFI